MTKVLEGYPSRMGATATLFRLLHIFLVVVDGFDPPSGLRQEGSGRVTTCFLAVVNNDKMRERQQSSDYNKSVNKKSRISLLRLADPKGVGGF